MGKKNKRDFLVEFNRVLARMMEKGEVKENGKVPDVDKKTGKAVWEKKWVRNKG